jgi:hypothetical protein
VLRRFRQQIARVKPSNAPHNSEVFESPISALFPSELVLVVQKLVYNFNWKIANFIHCELVQSSDTASLEDTEAIFGRKIENLGRGEEGFYLGLCNRNVKVE